MDQIDTSKHEKRELQKALKKADRKKEKAQTLVIVQGSSAPQTGELSEEAFEQERDRNQVLHNDMLATCNYYHVPLSQLLQDEVCCLKEDVEHHKSVIITLKSLISAMGNK